MTMKLPILARSSALRVAGDDWAEDAGADAAPRERGRDGPRPRYGAAP